MGCAVINRDLCIAVQGMRCEVCYRACPFIDSAIAIGASVREGDAIHAVFEPLVVLKNASAAACACSVAL